MCFHNTIKLHKPGLLTPCVYGTQSTIHRQLMITFMAIVNYIRVTCNLNTPAYSGKLILKFVRMQITYLILKTDQKLEHEFNAILVIFLLFLAILIK